MIKNIVILITLVYILFKSYDQKSPIREHKQTNERLTNIGE